MILYSTVILGTVFLVALISSFYHEALGLSVTYCILASIILAASVIAIDGILAFLVRRLPEKWFDFTHKKFGAKKKEAKFLEAIGIMRWKELVPELGGFTSFHKDKVRSPDDPEYLKRFILEANYGVIIHLSNAVLGYLILFITPLRLFYVFALPCAFVNMVLSLMPMCILRYNVPKLQILLRFALRRPRKPQGNVQPVVAD